MVDVFVLLPDFLLIALGWVLSRHTSLSGPLWEAVGRLTYYVLFPALLFVTIALQPLRPGALLPLAGSALAVVALGIAMSCALARWPGTDGRLHASGAQTAFRFNSYVALALAERLADAQGLACMALIAALCVPLCNVAAVWLLARHGGHGYLRELGRNPLILSTGAGLLFNVAGGTLPSTLTLTLGHIGAAALPLGLMSVGAGLTLGALRLAPGLAAGLLAIRHLALPAFALALVIALGLPPAQQTIVVAFAALPTASSAYVLAVRMGGHGGYVAGLVTVSTLVAMAGLPLALGLLHALR